MKKMHLELDALDVQTFDTMPGHARRGGTVLGNDSAPTYGPYDSCAASWCGDCQTGDDPACNGGTGDCPSVNVANCQSAWYTDCCPSQGWTECCGGGDHSTDPFDGDCT